MVATVLNVRFITALPVSHAVEPRPQAIALKQRCRVFQRLQPPDQRGIVRGDKAQGFQPQRLHPLRDQQAQRLLRVAARKTVETGVVPVLRRERSRPAGGRPRASGSPAVAGPAIRRCGRAGRASDPGRTSAGCGRYSWVEEANFVPMNTAIFGALTRLTADHARSSLAGPRSAPPARRSGKLSPGVSVAAKASSISPSICWLPRIRTLTVSVS